MQLRASLRNTFFSLALAGLAVSSAYAQGTTEEVPSAPAAPGMPDFPPVNPESFTASTPTKDAVNAFLQQLWGYDSDRVWQVQGIQKTIAPGLARVTVLAAQKSNPKQIGTLQFFITPDGGYLISNEVMPFGEHPFENAHQLLLSQATGPWRGAEAKTLELVEFGDFQCPHCKNAQPVVARLLQDFPNAHFVFENLPLVSIHPSAYKAAVASVCAAQQGGNDGFFKFADAVFDAQENLTPEGTDLALNNAATKVGLDPAKLTACMQAPEAENAVKASMKLAQTLNVNETPTLFVNGRSIPGFNTLPYDTLKKIIAFQAAQK